MVPVGAHVPWYQLFIHRHVTIHRLSTGQLITHLLILCCDIQCYTFYSGVPRVLFSLMDLYCVIECMLQRLSIQNI